MLEVVWVGGVNLIAVFSVGSFLSSSTPRVLRMRKAKKMELLLSVVGCADSINQIVGGVPLWGSLQFH